MRAHQDVLQRFEPAMSSPPLRARHGRGERSASLCVYVCMRVISATLFFGHRQILSHWDRLPPELRQTIQWTADRQQAHERLKRGWHCIHLNFEPCYICHRLLVINDQHYTLTNFPLIHIWKHHILIHFPLGHQWQPPHSPRLYHLYCMMDPPSPH